MGVDEPNLQNKTRRFVKLYEDMFTSEACKCISHPARTAYFLLKLQCRTQDPDEIVTLSFKQMEDFMDRHTISKVLRELEAYGFIEIVQRGGRYRKRNFYRFIEEWEKLKSE